MIIILEVPHQRDPVVWVAKGEEEIIFHAHNMGLTYNLWTRLTAIEQYEDDDWPGGLQECLEKSDKVIEFGKCTVGGNVTLQ